MRFGIGDRRGTIAATALLVAGLMATLPSTGLGSLDAQIEIEIEARSAMIRIGGRVHAQYQTSSVDDASRNDFLVRRARLTADIEVGDFFSGRVMPEFAGGNAKLADAWVRMNFDSSFRITMGQFQRPFDPFELTSSTQIAVVERDGRISGLDACAGVGGPCSLSRFTEKLEYAGRDIGIQADGRVGSFSYRVAMMNGTGTNTADENDDKSVSGRLVYAATDRLNVGAFFGVHDFLLAEGTPSQDTDYATAYGGDVEWGDFYDGLHLQVAMVGGENWKKLNDAFEPESFMTGQILASYYRPLESDRFEAIEPTGRVSWGDPDTDLDDDGGILWTPGVMLYVSGRNGIGANLDMYSPQTGDTEYGFKFQSYLYF